MSEGSRYVWRPASPAARLSLFGFVEAPFTRARIDGEMLVYSIPGPHSEVHPELFTGMCMSETHCLFSSPEAWWDIGAYTEDAIVSPLRMYGCSVVGAAMDHAQLARSTKVWRQRVRGEHDGPIDGWACAVAVAHDPSG